MNVRVISNGSREWDEYVLRLKESEQDIYYTGWYYTLMAEEINANALMFVCEEADSVGIYPFLKRKIEGYGLSGDFYDIETAYGYGGPLISTFDEDFKCCFEDEFLKYCASENIVAEFIRFHPLIANEKIFEKNIDVLHNRLTVWVDLTQSIDEIWMNQVSTKNRNVIRKCEKNGLYAEFIDDYEVFIDIYNETMKKVGAGGEYLFSGHYYDEMKNSENCRLLAVKRADEVIAAAIFMEYGDYFHYHLSGSRESALSLSPNNLLLWEAIKYAKEKGFKKMHLGGGLKDDEEDTLFKFKKKYSKNCADFYIGKRVHNKEIYDELIDKWKERTGKEARILLQYRE